MNAHYKQDPVTEGEIDMLLWALNNGRTEFAKVRSVIRIFRPYF